MNINLTREYVDELKQFIENQDAASALKMMDDLHPADIADLYDELQLEEAQYLFFYWILKQHRMFL